MPQPVKPAICLASLAYACMPQVANCRYVKPDNCASATASCIALVGAWERSGWVMRCAVAGEPKNKQMILNIGPQRMAAMLRQLGKAGAVQVCTTSALGTSMW